MRAIHRIRNIFILLFIIPVMYCLFIIFYHPLDLSTLKPDLTSPSSYIIPTLTIIAIFTSRFFFRKRLESIDFKEVKNKIKDYYNMTIVGYMILTFTALLCLTTIFLINWNLILILSWMFLVAALMAQYPSNKKIMKELNLRPSALGKAA